MIGDWWTVFWSVYFIALALAIYHTRDVSGRIPPWIQAFAWTAAILVSVRDIAIANTFLEGLDGVFFLFFTLALAYRISAYRIPIGDRDGR